MSILKKIKLGESTHQIQYTVVAPATGSVITATGTNTGDDVNANPQYELDVTVNDTLKKTDNALGVKLADVTYNTGSGELDVNTTNGKVLDASDAIPAINDALDAINTRIDDNERVTAAALNDLQDTVSAIKYNVSETTLILAGISQDGTLS